MCKGIIIFTIYHCPLSFLYSMSLSISDANIHSSSLTLSLSLSLSGPLTMSNLASFRLESPLGLTTSDRRVMFGDMFLLSGDGSKPHSSRSIGGLSTLGTGMIQYNTPLSVCPTVCLSFSVVYCAVLVLNWFKGFMHIYFDLILFPHKWILTPHHAHPFSSLPV